MSGDFVSNFYLLIYIFLWCALLYFHKKKVLYFGPASMIASIYLLWSLMSFILYNSGWFPDKYFFKLRLFPFFYLFLMLIIAMWPCLTYERKKITLIQRPSDSLVYGFFIVYIVATIFSIPESIDNLQNNLIYLLTDSGAGVEIYAEKTSGSASKSSIGLSSLIGFFSAIHNLFKDISVFVLFYYLTFKNKKTWLIILMFLIFVIDLAGSVASGGRTKFMLLVFSMVVSFFTFYKFWEKKTLSQIKKIMMFFIIIVSIPFVALTVSRFGYRADSGGTLGGTVDYAGQAPLVFNYYALEEKSTREGDRTASVFKRMLGYDAPLDFWEGRTKHSNMTLSDHDFSTFVGDFVLDYGPVAAPFIFLLVSMLFTSLTKTKDNRISFHKLFLLYFAMCVCIQGSQYLFAYAYKDNLVIFAFAFMYIIFRVDGNGNANKRRFVSIQ